MVVECDRHSLVRAPLCEEREPPAVFPDLILIEPPAPVERGLSFALDRSGGFSVNEARSIYGLEEFELFRDPVFFRVQVIVEKCSGIPATTYPDVMRGQYPFQRFRVPGELAACFRHR